MSRRNAPARAPTGLRGGRGTQRTTLLATLVGGLLLIGASLAFACIPWSGSLELDNVSDNASSSGESSTTTYGADHSDVTGTGNGQGMVWCSTLDSNAGQQYEWAEVRPDGDTSTTDVEFTVDDNGVDGCASDLYLPEDEYRITFVEDSFTNLDESTENGEPTFADNGSSTTNGGIDEVVGVNGGADDSNHCMDTEDDGDDDAGEVIFDLTEDDDGDGVASEGDGDDDYERSGGLLASRFPHPDDVAPNGNHRDVVDEGPHSMAFDFDQFAPDPSLSGEQLDPTAAAGLCISSKEDFEHDNNDEDDGEKDNIQIDYGNAVPVNVLSSV